MPAHLSKHMPAGGKGAPSSDEQREIDELRALIGTSPTRASTLQSSTFMRWKVGEENREGADAERREKEARKAEKDALEAKRLERAKELKDAARQQLERDKARKKELEEARLAEAKAQRDKEAAWQEKREKQAKEFAENGRKLVVETRERQKRMDRAEDAQDKLERDEATRDRLAVEAAFKKEREAVLAAKREKVQSVKQMTAPEHIAASKAWASKQRIGSAEDKRKQMLALKSQRRRVKEGHLERARSIKGQVGQIRENAKAVQAALHEKKKHNADGERANDYLVEQEKLRVLAQKKKDHAAVYAKRYAAEKAAKKWEATPLLAKGQFSSLETGSQMASTAA